MQPTAMPDDHARGPATFFEGGSGGPALPELRRTMAGMLADLFEYPNGVQAAVAAGCEEACRTITPVAAENLGAFRRYVETTPPGVLEEAYTAFFDLNPACSPYVGHLLFGETYKRSAFLVGLKERYRLHGFETDGLDLSDRLSVVLRFLSICRDEEECDTLVSEAVIPAIERLADGEERVPPPLGTDSDTELEGHSEGETLAPGFLLGMTDPDAATGSEQHPYRLLIQASRLLINALWPRTKPAGPDGAAK